MKKSYQVITDAAHGWVKVPVSVIKELDLGTQISGHSYYKKGNAYLEEDSDAPKFITAMERLGHKIKLRDLAKPALSGEERLSRVRNYPRFEKDLYTNFTCLKKKPLFKVRGSNSSLTNQSY